MKRIRRLATAALIVSALVVAPARAIETPTGGALFEPGKVLVKFSQGTAAARRAAAVRAIDGRIVRDIPHIGWSIVALPHAMPVERALAVLGRMPAVAAVEPNWLGTIALNPNDPCIVGCTSAGRQWNLGAVNAQLGWDVLPGRFYTQDEKKALPRLSVAVLDTKIDYEHPDWVNSPPPSTTNGWDARLGGQLDVENAYHPVGSALWAGAAAYHGSFVAGILAASANNATAVAGVAYRSSVMPITVVDGNGTAYADALADGLIWASDRGARVANLSLGLFQPSDAVQDAINHVTSRGMLVVAAAGNNANDQPFYPAWSDNVMPVSAVDEADRRGSCSNYGPHISVSAPGVGIVSIDPSRAEKVWVAPCGTSTAAPHVSALAALLFLQDPTRTPGQVRTLIERSADDDRFYPGHDVYFGAGRINVERALREGAGQTAPSATDVRATTPRSTGGSSEITALVVAPPGRSVVGAEAAVGVPGSAGDWIAMEPVDGAWGGAVERVRLVLDVAKDVPSGVRRVFVRGRDATATGSAGVGVLIIDRKAPEIRNLTATQLGIPTRYTPVRISFTAGDDYARALSYSFKVVSKVPGGPLFYQSSSFDAQPGAVTVDWTPEPTVVGPVDITVTLLDEAANASTAMTSTIVL